MRSLDFTVCTRECATKCFRKLTEEERKWAEIDRLLGNIKAIKKIVDKPPLSIYDAARIYAECCDALKGNENEG